MAFGKVDSDEAYDVEGLDLFEDVESMLRFNGLDVDALPPLKQPPPYTLEGMVAWQQSLAKLQADINADPELARAYILPLSPMYFGVTKNGKSKMPKRFVKAWIDDCKNWKHSNHRMNK